MIKKAPSSANLTALVSARSLNGITPSSRLNRFSLKAKDCPTGLATPS